MLQQNTMTWLFYRTVRCFWILICICCLTGFLYLHWIGSLSCGYFQHLHKRSSSSQRAIDCGHQQIYNFRRNSQPYRLQIDLVSSINVFEPVIDNAEEEGFDMSDRDNDRIILDGQNDSTLVKDMPSNRFIRNQNLRRKFLLAFRYYEQLGASTRNLLALSSLAHSGNRSLVTPFVRNSRMSGLPTGAGSRGKETFAPFEKYFDVNKVNATLKERGYATLDNLDVFLNECYPNLDVLIHFLYNETDAALTAWKWYKLDAESYRSVKETAKRKGGWTDCQFLKRAKLGVKFGQFQVKRYICVDPDLITDPQIFENIILQNAKCVAFMQWRGIGRGRTHFESKSMMGELKPSDLKHNKRLIDIAIKYTTNYIRKPYVSIHVRLERHVLRRGMHSSTACIKRLLKKVTQRQTSFKVSTVYIASDLIDNGSETFKNNAKKSNREKLNEMLLKSINQVRIFDPKLYNLTDTGEIAIIEMHILSMGESLFTIGGGNFQDWIINLFLSKNAEDTSLIHRLCVLR